MNTDLPAAVLTDDEAQQLVQRLMATGMNASEIADAMEKRVSKRTVYRWAKGESTPQQASDLQVLQELVRTKLT
jgi:transposase